MTEFSYPSELVDPYPDVDTWFFGGIARATTDVAVAAWTSQRYNQGLAPLAPMHLAAIRYTDTGPEMGQTLTVGVPSEIMIYRVIEGHDSQVWVLGADSENPGIKLGLATVSPNLEVSFQWKYTIPSRRNPGYGGGVMAASWPDMDLIVIATNEGRPEQRSMDLPWVHVVDMNTGAVIESVQTPRYEPEDTRTDYYKVYPESIALHRESGRLLICADWWSQSNYVERAGLWTIEVSTSGLGEWTKVGDVPRVSEVYSYSLRWATMAATELGWTILLMSRYSYGVVRWFHLKLDGTITSLSPDPITYNGTWNAYNNITRPWDCAYDVAYNRSIACYMEWGNWFYNFDPEGRHLSGFMHLESDDDATVTAMQVLPRSDGHGVDYVQTMNVAVVGPGRYIYLCASTGILRPRGSQYYASFGPVVYVGGDGSTTDFVSARLGGQVDESRRAFRTVAS